MRLRKISAASRSASFHAAALPSKGPLTSAVVNLQPETIVVLALTPTRPSAASTRSSANRGCPGALVNGDHAVETRISGAVCTDCAAATIQTAPDDNMMMAATSKRCGRSAHE